MDFLDSLAVRRTFPALARTGPGNPGMEQRAIAVAPGSRDSVTVIWVETRP